MAGPILARLVEEVVQTPLLNSLLSLSIHLASTDDFGLTAYPASDFQSRPVL